MIWLVVVAWRMQDSGALVAWPMKGEPDRPLTYRQRSASLDDLANGD
jgi:hypothetical protein